MPWGDVAGDALGARNSHVSKTLRSDPRRLAYRIVDNSKLSHPLHERVEARCGVPTCPLRIFALQLLLTILLCKELGIIESSLCEVLKQNPKWLQIIHLDLAKGA